MGSDDAPVARPAGARPGAAVIRPLLLVLLVVAPLVELYVIVQVGQEIGALATIALLLVVSAVGASLLRRQGARTWRAFQVATAAGQVPAREVADGALLLLAGALLLAPGFVSDAFGALLLLPPVRALVRAAVLARTGTRLLGPLGPVGGRGRTRSSRVVDGSVVDGTIVDGSVVDGSVVDRSPDDPRT